MAGPAIERAWRLADTAKLREEERLLRLQADDLEVGHRAFAARTLYFSLDVVGFSVGAAAERILDWRLAGNGPIYVYFNSPGGDVFEGFMLYDILMSARRDGIPVETFVCGYAASMASVLSQVGDKRTISQNSWYMIHEPSTIVVGTSSGLQDEAKLIARIHDQMLGLLAERSHLSKEEIFERCERKDWWMPAQEALEYGFFDAVG